MDVIGANNFVSNFRKSGIAVAAATVMAASSVLGVTSAQAGDFSKRECFIIDRVTTDVVTTLGVENFSDAFLNSLQGFISPDGTNATCDGPKRIATPKGEDVDAFNTIRASLGKAKRPIDLYKRGLEAVASL